MPPIFEGLRVLEFGSWMTVPLAGMVFSDYGAQVIKVEPPGGDPGRTTPAFQTWNRGKKGVVIDLKSPAGREIARPLIRSADVLLVGYRPAALRELGLDFESISADNPTAIYASVTGFGEDGPRSRLKGYEGLVDAVSGRLGRFGTVADRGREPGIAAVPCAAFSTAMLTIQGVVAALRVRRLTNRGQKVHTSMLASLLPFDFHEWIEPQPIAKAVKAKRQESIAPSFGLSGAYNRDHLVTSTPVLGTPSPPYATAVTSDDVWLQFSNGVSHLYAAQLNALELSDLYTDERFGLLPAVNTENDADALWDILLAKVRTKTYAEWSEIFDASLDVAVDRLLDPRETMTHRQVVHNGLAASVVGLRDQETIQPGILATFSGRPSRIGGRAPLLGEHTDQILAEAAVVNSTKRSASREDVGERPSISGTPLEGVTIVDFSMYYASPYATSILSTLGARIISVEPLEGAASRLIMGGLMSFSTIQGKESLALNLKTAAGQEVARRLIARTDVLLHNFRRGVPERLGIDEETCRGVNPRIVYAYAGSYGSSGPDSPRPAFHPIAGAIAGSARRQAGAGHPRKTADLDLAAVKQEAFRLMKANESAPDPVAALGVATAILLGLHARDISGQGLSIETTMIGSNMYANSDILIYDDETDNNVVEVDSDVYGFHPTYRLYKSQDCWVFLACLRLKEWAAFCEMVERPDLVTHFASERTLAASEIHSLAEEIASILLTRSAIEWQEAAEHYDVPLVCVEARNPGDFWYEDEETTRQGYKRRVVSPVHGPYDRHGPLIRFSSSATSVGPFEPLGAHSRLILADLGYDEDAVQSLIAGGVVGVGSSNS